MPCPINSGRYTAVEAWKEYDLAALDKEWTRRVKKVAQLFSAGRRGDRGPPHPRGPDRSPEARLRLRSSGCREAAGVNRSTQSLFQKPGLTVVGWVQPT